MSDQQPKQKISLAVYRCLRCGDTFPAEAKPICPVCGAEAVEPAWEPLL